MSGLFGLTAAGYSASTANGRIAALAADRAVHRAFRWLHLHEPQIRRWQAEASAIPAPPFGEDARAAWFRERFVELGLQNPHLDVEGNALAELPGRAPGRGPMLLLSAHLDTVFPPGTDCTPREQGDLLLGPGVSDNGAGLAALLALAAAMQDSGLQPACTVLFAANVGEEGEGDLRGMRHLFQSAPYAGRVGAAIALEGAGTATVISRALGSRRLRVTITGPGGHSWADFGRPNPIVTLSQAIAAIAALSLPTQPRTTLNCGLIRGGTSVNSIPESASADFDLRSVSGRQLDQTELHVLHLLERLVGEANGACTGDTLRPPALRLHVQRIGDRPSGELPESSPLLVALGAVDRHLQLATESRIGSTDANLPLSLRIPALALSAGGTGGGMHTLEEWYDPAGRTLALRRVLLLVLEACRQLAEEAC